MNVNNSTQGNVTSAWTWTPPVPVSTEITLYSILLVWSLLGNILVIAVVYCNQNLKTNMNYLIVNMAVSDLLVPLVAMPYFIPQNATNYNEWLVDGPLGEALCKLVHFLSGLSPFVSSISLVIIALRRFMAVVYPTRRQLLSRQTRWIAISFPWIVAMAFNSPVFYVLHLTNKHGYTKCSLSTAFDRALRMILHSMATAVGFAVPLIVIITLYMMIIYKLRRSLDNVRGMMEEEIIRSRQKTNRRIFSMLITIVLLFIMCWCPLFTFLILLQMKLYISLDFVTRYRLWFAFHYMWYLQAAINPCIYFVFLKDFRQGLKSLCCGKNMTSANEQILRRPPTPGGDSNQDPTCAPTHINATSV